MIHVARLDKSNCFLSQVWVSRVIGEILRAMIQPAISTFQWTLFIHSSTSTLTATDVELWKFCPNLFKSQLQSCHTEHREWAKFNLRVILSSFSNLFLAVRSSSVTGLLHNRSHYFFRMALESTNIVLLQMNHIQSNKNYDFSEFSLCSNVNGCTQNRLLITVWKLFIPVQVLTASLQQTKREI